MVSQKALKPSTLSRSVTLRISLAGNETSRHHHHHLGFRTVRPKTCLWRKSAFGENLISDLYFFKQEGISTLVLCRHFCRTWKPISVHKYLLQNSTSILWKCSFPHWKKGFRVLAGCASLNLQALPPPLLMWGHCCPPIQVHLTTFDCTPVKWL